MRKNGFTFIELIICMSLIVTVFSMGVSLREKQNDKILDDICDTITKDCRYVQYYAMISGDAKMPSIRFLENCYIVETDIKETIYFDTRFKITYGIGSQYFYTKQGTVSGNGTGGGTGGSLIISDMSNSKNNRVITVVPSTGDMEVKQN